MRKILRNINENWESACGYTTIGLEITRCHQTSLKCNVGFSLINGRKYSKIDLSTSYHIKKSVNNCGNYRLVNITLKNKYFEK